MTKGRKLDKRVLVPGLAVLALLVIGAEAPSFAQRRAEATRSSGSGGSSSGSKASSGGGSSASSVSSSGPSTRGATTRDTASASRAAKPRAVKTRQSTPASRSRRGSGRPHHYHHDYDIGLHFGFGRYYGWGAYYGYYYPYYYHPFYWGVPYYVPRRAYRDDVLGAFDLNVRPKKTEVYLDGQFIGTAGQFDGFPDHLWLEQGSYELIFYYPGLGTERRVLSIYPGVVVDVRLRMQPGESLPPAELTSVDRSEEAMTEVRSAYQRQKRQPAPAAPEASAELDTRTAPGRVRLSVLPADASVYLDGRLLGSGDELARLHAGLVVEAGSHLLEVVRPGYTTVRRQFSVESGDEVELEVLLESG